MTTERLLRKASQVLATAAVAGCLAAPSVAVAQYAVSDSQLSADVGKAVSNDAKLQSMNIAASASQGVVTLTGTVPNEDARVEAEQVAASVDGVRSIQDNIKVAGQAAGTALPPAAQRAPDSAPQASSTPAPPPDPSQPPAPPDTAQPPVPPDTAQSNDAQSNGMPPAPPAQPGTAESGMPPTPPVDASAGANNVPYQGGETQNQAPYAQNYPNQPGGYEQPGGWGQRGNAHVPNSYNALAVSPQRQNASGPVTIPAGSLLTVRTDQPLSTNDLKAGEYFQATAAADVYENGVVAIPRGAVFTGQVVEAKNAGAFGGRPKLDLKLNSIQLGAATYPIGSQVWSSQGPSKTGYTAANAAGGAVFGALIGAIAGGGVGAGVGAIAGGAGGAAIAGATHGPRLDLPPETLLEFHLSQPLTVKPVHFEEAQRMVNSAPPAPTLQRRPMYAPYPPPPPPYPYGAPYPY